MTTEQLHVLIAVYSCPGCEAPACLFPRRILKQLASKWLCVFTDLDLTRVQVTHKGGHIVERMLAAAKMAEREYREGLGNV